ncbi:MAG: MFS transporter [Magnetococcales bacterium]|nr:MFS transporter [Magnetococcales bacterium]MBF0322801.1 MFS transporter [Magnetococcales bacterium]
MTRTMRLLDFLAMRRETAGLLLLVMLVGMGERLAERFLPIYLLALGGGSLVVGLLGAMDNLLSALYSLPGGYLAERFGMRRSLLFINLTAMAGYLLVILVPRWEAVLAGAVLFLAWSSLSLPASMGLIAKVLPSNKRTMGVTMHALVKRIPMALGPMIGGMCIDRLGEVAGIRISFTIALIMAIVGLIAQQRLIPDDRPTQAESPPHSLGRLLALITPAMRRLLVSDILVRFCEQIPQAFVVVWCMKTMANPISGAEFGLLTTIEMATAILIYLPVAFLADRAEKKPFVLVTFALFTLFPLVLLATHSFTMLAGAFVLRGLKEFGEPTRKALILDLAPPDHRAAAFGAYYLVRDMVVSLGALSGAFLWELGPQVNFLTAAAFGLVGTLWFLLWGKGQS